jgi:DNA/RNA-binding domain of Phe-tRNA-synthetase-like protein
VDDPGEWLARVTVDGSIRTLRADYRALAVLVVGVRGGPSDRLSEGLLSSAERAWDPSRAAHLHLVAWREAYASFGVRGGRHCSSVEALARRVPEGIPRVDRVTDTYNAVSLMHLVPVGGEDAERYVGHPHLTVARGGEPFEVLEKGELRTYAARTGEPVWSDDAGVTCRRWNWRQCTRTRITPATRSAFFVVDALAPFGAAEVSAAGAALVAALLAFSPGASAATRLLAAS